jgi:preprotein translocase subunit SecE
VNRIIQRPINFIKEVKQELVKVAWSSREELMGSTVVVIVTTFIMAVFIGAIDLLLSKIVSVVFR